MPLKTIKRSFAYQRGVTATSYGLLVGLIAIVALVAVTNSGSSINSLFAQTANSLGSVADSGPGTGPGSSTPTPTPDITGLASCAEINAAAPSLPDGNYQIDPDGNGGNAPVTASCDMTSDGGGWTLIYDYSLPAGALDINTVAQANALSSVNLSAQPISFGRVAYRVDLDSNFVFASVDDFTSGTLAQTGIPADWHYQQSITGLNVDSNSGNVAAASNEAGRIEFWHNCYSRGTNSLFDYEDVRSTSNPDCYGSMQLFNAADQAVFTFNAWSDASSAQSDMGLGPNQQPSNSFCPNGNAEPDWTYCYNANQYSTRRIRVYVK